MVSHKAQNLDGSMDSLYEPVPEQHANQESTSDKTGSLISSFGESGKAYNNLFMCSQLVHTWGQPSGWLAVRVNPNHSMSIWRSLSENKGFGRKTINDTIWQESCKLDDESHIRRLCQLKGKPQWS
ncbi:putative uncharacterized protein ENSP00000383407 [Artibeus jamaicensis]|uniref:putative uncharacterized protein ENSP00000383407 n=1 Tax=Artibeus jamaicensis TaxID=9417 RepID=UPI00235B11AC|nr:putative uncharacterized protein ENSP00000383407 [Artibeus jamaicensis]